MERTTDDYDARDAIRERYPEIWGYSAKEDGRMFMEDGWLRFTYDSAVASQEIHPDELPKVMAMANEVLDDNSPYKIAHAMIGTLDYAIQSMLMSAESPMTPDDVKQDAREYSAELISLRATLQALLPPASYQLAYTEPTIYDQ